MTPATLNLALCEAASSALASQAASAPGDVTSPLLERTSLWAARARYLIAPTSTPDSSERDCAELLKVFAPQDTHRVARPVGIFSWRFHGELLVVPPDFERQVREAKTIRLEFERGSGGDGGVADRMIAMLKGAGVPVHGHVSGFAGSAHADLFVLGTTPTHRTMRPSAKLMVHASRFVTYGTEAALRKAADDLREMNQRIAGMYAERTGLPLEVVSEWFNGKDFWFDSNSALSNGLVDRIID